MLKILKKVIYKKIDIGVFKRKKMFPSNVILEIGKDIKNARLVDSSWRRVFPPIYHSLTIDDIFVEPPYLPLPSCIDDLTIVVNAPLHLKRLIRALDYYVSKKLKILTVKAVFCVIYNVNGIARIFKKYADEINFSATFFGHKAISNYNIIELNLALTKDVLISIPTLKYLTLTCNSLTPVSVKLQKSKNLKMLHIENIGLNSPYPLSLSSLTIEHEMPDKPLPPRLEHLSVVTGSYSKLEKLLELKDLKTLKIRATFKFPFVYTFPDDTVELLRMLPPIPRNCIFEILVKTINMSAYTWQEGGYTFSLSNIHCWEFDEQGEFVCYKPLKLQKICE